MPASRSRRSLVVGFALFALALSACGSSSTTTAKPAAGQSSPPASGTAPVATIAPAPPTGPVPPAVNAGLVSWPGALHDAAHSGTSAVVGPQGATIRWTHKLEGPISAGPAVAVDGTIYESSNAGILHALDPMTGADKWTFNGGGSADDGQDLSTTAAILSDGTILWPGPRSTLFALDPSGRMLWSQALQGTVLSPAVGATGKVYVADSKGDVVALAPTPTTVSKLWTISIGKESFGSPALAADGTIYGTADKDLVAITDAGDHATVAWRFHAGDIIEVSPSVAPDGTVVLGTNDPYEYGITAKGAVAWKYPRKAFSYSTPAATVDGLAYFGDNDGYVDVVNSATGKPLGRYDGTAKAISSVGVGVWTAPLVDARHDVYFGTAAGHIFGFAYGGARLFDFNAGATVDSYPALTPDGTLVIGADNGMLYGFHA